MVRKKFDLPPPKKIVHKKPVDESPKPTFMEMWAQIREAQNADMEQKKQRARKIKDAIKKTQL